MPESRQSAITSPLDDRPLVLVAEDYPELNKIIVNALSRSFRVVSALDGLSALELARRERPDAVVTDVMMPEVGGETVIRELRRESAFDDTPILVLTSVTDQDLRLELLSAGADDYLLKPFSMRELSMRVGKQVSQARARRLLRAELASHSREIESLARELVVRNRDLEAMQHRVIDAADEMRLGLARELHDGLGQLLTGIELLAKGLSNEVQGDARDRANRIAALIAEASAKVRLVYRGLPVPELATSRLPELLDRLAEATRSLFSVECRASASGEETSRDERVRAHAYWIAKEAVTNAVRHGKAKSIQLRVAFGAPSTLIVEDDGLGFGSVPASDGVGLEIMEYRAKLLGGRFAISKGDRGGTCVRVEW